MLRKATIGLLLLMLSIAAFSVALVRGQTIVWTELCADPGILSVYGVEGGNQVDCYLPDEPTPTPLPPAPTTTATITPTLTATPPAGPIFPYPDAPECLAHDPTGYHGLWDYELGCHYDHSHGGPDQDPHQLDALFGTALFDYMGGEISYPWQTPNENLYKHGAYQWYIASNPACNTYFGTPGSFSNVRALVHGVGAAQGNVVPNHSFVYEVETCVPGSTEHGKILLGGWLGPSELIIDGVTVLNEGNHPPRGFLSYYDAGNRCCSTWYNGHLSGLSFLAVEFGDMWTTVPPYHIDENGQVITHTTAAEIVQYAEFINHPKNNSSQLQLHDMGFSTARPLMATLDPDGDGYADYSGYTNRNGYLVDGCTEPGLDCVPLIIENVYIGTTQAPFTYKYRGGYHETDICFTADGVQAPDCRGGQSNSSGWLEYPIITP